jgi:hypothetical protein
LNGRVSGLLSTDGRFLIRGCFLLVFLVHGKPLCYPSPHRIARSWLADFEAMA